MRTSLSLLLFPAVLSSALAKPVDHPPAQHPGHTSYFTTSCAIQGDCVTADPGLHWLASQLSAVAVISCRGSPLQLYNADRYWGELYGKNASVVVFPATPQDVSFAVQAAGMTTLGLDYAFVGGAHGMTNASSSYDFVIDLSYLNHTRIVQNYTLDGSPEAFAVVAYEGGTTAEQVSIATNGSGYIAVTPRVSSVGMGGFTTGGGIGFLAGPYGFATDRLVAMDVVLPGTGDLVTATASNEYSDLFFALHGGGGQFGIVTTFYQKAAPEPKQVNIAVYFISEDSIEISQEHAVEFFSDNRDPFSLIYYAAGFFPLDLFDPNPDPASFAVRTALITLWIDNPLDPEQENSNVTFAKVVGGLSFDTTIHLDVGYVDLYQAIDIFFPYGYRRGFYGPQTTNITTSYLQNAATILKNCVEALLARGEFPASALWAIQYMSPGLNGNLPASNADTAWPHATAGHQTLFSPAWSNATDDQLAVQYNDMLNNLTYAQQALYGPLLADYPNYIGPDDSGSRVWGENVGRLIEIKQKYDPLCTIHNGRVFASLGCVLRGFGNIFA